MNLQLAQLILWLPLLGFLFCSTSGLYIKDRALQKRLTTIIAPGVVLAAFAIALFVTLQFGSTSREIIALIPGASIYDPWIRFGGFRVNFNEVLDPLSLVMALVVTGVGGLIHVYSIGYMKEDRDYTRFFTYFNLFIFMMLLLILGDNFLLMFVGWEGVGVCSYLLISFWFSDTANARAGNKAFIVNRVGDLGFSLGIMTIWAYFGTVSFYTPQHRGVLELANHVGRVLDVTGAVVPASVITMICLLLLVGAIGKSAQIPLFVWLPDAMAGPTPVSALIHAATMVTAGVVMLSRCSFIFVHSAVALQAVAWIGLATAFAGAAMAMVQTDIKKVLAYSTISQLGYMFIACGVGDFTDGIFHVVTHAFFKALLFLGAGAVIHSMLGEQDMRKMGGLKKKLPSTWAVMLIATYSIAGFPLLSGFWSKDAILESASRSFAGNGMLLYAGGLITAFMTAFYMNRLMWKTFYTRERFTDGHLHAHQHGDSDESGHAADAHGGGSVHTSPSTMMWPLFILAVLAVGFGWFAGPFGPGGGNLLRKFLEPSIAPLSLGGLQPQADLLSPMAGYILSSLIAIGGLSLAAVLYGRRMETGAIMDPAAAEASPLVRLLKNNLGFDAVYNIIFIKFGGLLAERGLMRGVEADTINAAGDGIAKSVGGMSHLLRRIQTGYVRNYALVMLVGVVTLMVGMLVGVMQH
jgi:NADH-quinone oxidoreductase subunit L